MVAVFAAMTLSGFSVVSASPAAAHHGSGPAGCSLSTGYSVTANTPYAYYSIVSTGQINQNQVYCHNDPASGVKAQTKVCGAWGCNWETKNKQHYTPDSTSSYYTASQTCRSGTRTATGPGWTTATGTGRTLRRGGGGRSSTTATSRRSRSSTAERPTCPSDF